ncbi:MAG: flagellar motor protein MotB [Nitrospirae bacterium]|nr:flagellar motor protein MotB [Nitrospirota bacterium]
MNDSYKKIVEQFTADGEDNLWLITMTDLMSLLLVCFLMFFVISKRNENATEKAQQQAVTQSQSVETEAVTAQTPHSTPAPALDSRATETSAVAAIAADDGAATSVVVTTADKSPDDVKAAAAVIDPAPELEAVVRAQNLSEEVTITTAEKGVVITMREKVSFVPASAVILKNSAPVLDKVSELIKRHPSYVIEIDGHTDNSPIHSPLYPSNWELSTARATSVLQYLIAKGVDPKGFAVKGNGDSAPIAPNDTPAHRAQNRRVEIRIKEKTI